MRPTLLLTLGLAVGCETPCTELNAAITALYEDCGINLPADLEDGGEGDCAIDEDESVCDQDCYEASDCGAIDGSDAAAAEALSVCLADCAPDA